MTFPAGIRHFVGFRLESLKKQPSRSTGSSDALYSSTNSPRFAGPRGSWWGEDPGCWWGKESGCWLGEDPGCSLGEDPARSGGFLKGRGKTSLILTLGRTGN